jgi:hypothetical protein
LFLAQTPQQCQQLFAGIPILLSCCLGQGAYALDKLEEILTLCGGDDLPKQSTQVADITPQ